MGIPTVLRCKRLCLFEARLLQATPVLFVPFVALLFLQQLACDYKSLDF